jgi:hypothetical protein
MVPIYGICGYSNRNIPPSRQNDGGAISIPPEVKKKRGRPKKENSTKPAKSPFEKDIALVFGTKSYQSADASNVIEIILPLRTVSEANCFEPWQKKHKRHKAQKRAVIFSIMTVKSLIKTPCTIRITRFAPKMLDAHDNLRISVKYILDQVCAEILNDFRPGRADGYEGFKFEYDQVKSKEYAVKIEIIY